MNPAALVSNVRDVVPGGIVVVNEDAFRQTNFDKAHLASNPLDDETLKGYRLYRVPMEKLTTLVRSARCWARRWPPACQSCSRPTWSR